MSTPAALACLALGLTACAGTAGEPEGARTPAPGATSHGSATPTETSTAPSESTPATSPPSTTAPTKPTPDRGDDTGDGAGDQPPATGLRARVASMTLREKAGQVMVVHFAGTEAPVAMIRRLQPGGLIYFSENLTSVRQVTDLSARSQRAAAAVGEPLLLMTDQEGGDVSRMPGISEPAGIDLAGDRRAARRVAASMGRRLSAAGIGATMAPVADVNTVGDEGVIAGRAFGSTPGAVSPMVTSQICGFRRGGVASAAKHFPGHGSTSIDSHELTPTIEHSAQEWWRTDAPPFLAAVEADVEMILVGHLAFPALDPSGRPATISRRLNAALIRGRLGFDGVVITDALNMGGITRWGDSGKIAVQSLRAGSDLLLMPSDPDAVVAGIVRAVRSGDLPRRRLDSAVRRVLKLKQASADAGTEPRSGSC